MLPVRSRLRAGRLLRILLTLVASTACVPSKTFVVLPAEANASWIVGAVPTSAANGLTVGDPHSAARLLVTPSRDAALELLTYPQSLEALGLRAGPLGGPACGRSCALLDFESVFRASSEQLEESEAPWVPITRQQASADLLAALVPDARRCEVCNTFESHLLRLGTTAIPRFVSAEPDGRALIGFVDGSLVRLSVTGAIEPACLPGDFAPKAGLREGAGDVIWFADSAERRLGFLRLSAQSADRPCTIERWIPAPTQEAVYTLAGRTDPDAPEIYAVTGRGELMVLDAQGWRKLADIPYQGADPPPPGNFRAGLAFIDSNNVLASSGGATLWQRLDGVERMIEIHVPVRVTQIVSIGVDPLGVVLGLDRFGLVRFTGTAEPPLFATDAEYHEPSTIVRAQDRWLVFLDLGKMYELVDGHPPCPQLDAGFTKEPNRGTMLSDGWTIAVGVNNEIATQGHLALVVRPNPPPSCE